MSGMVRSFLYKDVVSLRYRLRSFITLIVAVAALLVVLAFGMNGMMASLLGVDFLRLFLLSMAGLAAFLDNYATSLASDKDSGIFAMVMLGERTKIGYFAVKGVVPIVLGLLTSVVTIVLYSLTISESPFSVAEVLRFVALMAGELFLAMGLGMLLNVVGSLDVKTNPSVALPLVLVNVPLLYFASPVRHLCLFVALATGLGLLAFAVSVWGINARYRCNLTGT